MFTELVVVFVCLLEVFYDINCYEQSYMQLAT